MDLIMLIQLASCLVHEKAKQFLNRLNKIILL